MNVAQFKLLRQLKQDTADIAAGRPTFAERKEALRKERLRLQDERLRLQKERLRLQEERLRLEAARLGTPPPPPQDNEKAGTS
jgi:hypothetical protein